jgi:hypothetical protein
VTWDFQWWRFKPQTSGLWHWVVMWWDNCISQDHATSIFISPWRWKQHGPPKRWYPIISLHGYTSQKTATFTVPCTCHIFLMLRIRMHQTLFHASTLVCLLPHHHDIICLASCKRRKMNMKLKGKIVLVLNYATHCDNMWGSGGMAPHVLYLSTTWRWMVSFPPNKSSWHPSNRLCLTQSWSGPSGKNKYNLKSVQWKQHIK